MNISLKYQKNIILWLQFYSHSSWSINKYELCTMVDIRKTQFGLSNTNDVDYPYFFDFPWSDILRWMEVFVAIFPLECADLETGLDVDFALLSLLCACSLCDNFPLTWGSSVTLFFLSLGVPSGELFTESSPPELSSSASSIAGVSFPVFLFKSKSSNSWDLRLPLCFAFFLAEIETNLK